MRNNPGWKYVSATRGAKTITFGMPYDGYHRVDPNTQPARFARPTGAITFNNANSQTYSSGPMFKYFPEETKSINAKSVIGYGLEGIKSMAPVLDAAFMPPSTKVQGTYSTDSIASTLDIALTKYAVDDINEVARIYESNGYAVSRYAQPNNLNTFHNRQLYDYLQCDDVNVCGIMDATLLADFIERLNAGIRLWHTDGNGELICTKPPFGIRLGVLCVRDNTEV